MNIFFLDEDPSNIASMLNDKHVVKMTLESAQMLSTAHRLLDGDSSSKRFRHPNPKADSLLYKVAHPKHISTVWTLKNKSNYDWHYALFESMSREYSFRYGREHSSNRLMPILKSAPVNIESGEFCAPPLAMHDTYKQECHLAAYRDFYAGEKWRFSKWKNRMLPRWFISSMERVWNDERNQERIVALAKIRNKKTRPLDVKVFETAMELAHEVA